MKRGQDKTGQGKATGTGRARTKAKIRRRGKDKKDEGKTKYARHQQTSKATGTISKKAIGPFIGLYIDIIRTYLCLSLNLNI
jgi:hypothetical protein